jgi:Protein of unknown function (DUF1553)/Protein of unknown function (DUF1549)/Planctomycete cytochrome C
MQGRGANTHADGPQWRTLRGSHGYMERSYRKQDAAWIVRVVSIALFASVPIPVRAGDDAGGVAFFEGKIRPVLVERCYECHSSGAKKLRGGLRLDTREGIRTGGDTGPAVVPGNLDESLLFQAISGAQGVDRMPPKGVLSAGVVADFREWIKMGAPDPRDGKAAVAAAAKLAGRSDWWSLKPLARPAVPRIDAVKSGWSANPIDAFILVKLNEKQLAPSPEADRRTLIRRLSFDLLGLPPEPEEIDAFENDRSADAYARLVERLLGNPHYGERWARYWMDLVHFAETHGHDQDRIRPNAWPYRDYLIRSFNRDKPYGRFVAEQVAADALFPDEPELVVALGMLAAGPWDESSLRDIRDDSIDRQIGHYMDRDDMVSTVMSTFVSSTAGCARCHDHKFDPISQDDYYSLQAVFAGVDKAERPYDTDKAVGRLRRSLAEQLAAAGKSNPDRAGWISAFMAALPPPQLVFAAASEFAPDAGHKPPGGPRAVSVLRRGDIHFPVKPASPGTLGCLKDLPSRFMLEQTAHESARRACLARWIIDPRNSLSWRSIVNRAWQHHFGRGLVSTPNDFGRMGAVPSHPELLDWLATTFRDSGGSLKQLDRLIVTSETYRQCAASEASFAAKDADNQWLWRQNRRRLDAESIHDAILKLAGRLDTTMGGPSVQQFTLGPGVHVTPVVDYTKYDWNSQGSCRRAVYRFVFRTLPDPFYDALDSADPSQLTAVRSESTTPLQALELLNNPFVLRQCGPLAERLSHASPKLEDQIRLAFLAAYGRPAASEELSLLGGYAARHGLLNFCRVIVNSNEFLFVN